MRRASTNFNAQLGVHFFLWLQVRGAVTLDGTNHPRIKISPGVACCARIKISPAGRSHIAMCEVSRAGRAEWPGDQILSNPCNGSWGSMPTA